MSNIKDVNMRLQLRHNDATQVFKGREDVITYIDNRLKYNSSDVSILPYEPVLFFYGEEETKNTIILVGLPEGETYDGKNYFLIDTAELKEAIANEAKAREDADGELKDSISGFDDAIATEKRDREAKDTELAEAIASEKTEREAKDTELAEAIASEKNEREAKDIELTDAINFTNDDLKSVIKACGLVYNDKLETDRISYTPDMKDEVIRDAKDITEAIDLISKFSAKVGKDLVLSVADTNSVALALEGNAKGDGNVLTAEVKLSESGSISSKTADDDNILSVQKDGLYATVDLDYDPYTHVLTFRKSDKKNSDGVEKPFKLGGHTVYKGVNDGHTVKMTVETTGDNGTIAGDVVVSTDTHNNLKVKDGALFVDNHSKSVVYDEDDTVTVYSKIHSLDESVANVDGAIKAEEERAKTAEENNANAIVTNADAIDAEVIRAKDAEKVNADAIEVNEKAIKTNADAIAVINGNEATDGSIKKALADAKAHSEEVAEAAKDSSKEYTDAIADSIEVVKNGVSDLQYILYVNKKNVGTIDIPKDQFLKNVEYNPKSKEITFIFTIGTGDAYEEKKIILNVADLVDVYKAGDGLSEKENELSVKLSGDKETKKYLAVDANGITLNGVDGAIETAVSDETDRAKGVEKEIKTIVEDHTDKIDTIQGTGIGSIKRALKDANEYADAAVEVEKKRAEKSERELETVISDEVTRAEKVEGEIKAIADKNAGDIDDLTKSLNTLDGNAVKSVTLTKNADNALLYTLNVDGKTYDINIPQDQFLSNVTYDSGYKTLHFVFNVGDAKQDIDVQIGDLVDTYTAGNGMHVDNNAFSIQLQPTEQTVKYLEVSENGLGVKGLDEAIAASVKSVSDGVYTKKEIDDKDAAVKSVADANKTLIDSLTTRVTTNEDDIKANKEAITSKADASNVYTKAETYKKEEVDNAVSLKANTAEVAATYATKDELTKGTADINKAIDSKLDKDSAAATYATIGSVTTVDGKVDALKTELTSEISKKADAANVYTKLDITNELAKYEKTASVDTKLATKLDATTATQTYATKEALQGVKDAYATKEYVAAEDVKLNTLAEANKAAIDNFNVEYNPATSVLSYTDKKGTKNEYKLYSGSLIKSGKFDEKSNSIVLTIETAGQPSEISIPVSDLLSDVTSDITANANAIQSINDAIAKLAKKWDVTSTGTVTLKKSTTGETDSLSADVRVASSNKQAIQSKEDGLYVSNDLEDYTVAYGGLGTISGQTAISKLLEASTAVEGKLSTLATSSDTALATLKTQVETNTKSIEALRTDVTNNTAKINTISDKVTEHSTTLKELGEKVTKHTTDIATLTTQVNTIDKTVASHTTKIENLEGDVTTLQTTVSTINNDITNIKNDVKENKTNISKIEGKVETVENNLKTLETKVTTLESTVNNKITSLENTVKELTNTINNIQTNLEKTIESIVKEKVNEAIKISSAEGNIITNKTDGLYAAVDGASVLKTIPVSGAAGNIIVKNDDGLYAKVDETKIDVSKINLLSQTEGNLLEAKTDGLYLSNVFDEGEY